MNNPTVTLDGTTRGPWSVHGRLDGDKTFAVEPNNASTNAEFVIALCYGPEAKANAEAIAKLPDLARSCIAQAETIAELIASTEETHAWVRRIQDVMTGYLIPDGYDADEALNRLLEMLDGPEQRAIQSRMFSAVRQAKGGDNGRS